MSDQTTLELDGYLIGDPIRDSFGVTSRPAIFELDGSQHFIKQVHIPASETQTNALLLTGAYTNEAEVQAYYHAVACDIFREAETLKQLGESAGFIPFDHYEIIENEPVGGYTVQMQSIRHASIFDRQWTHRDAINFGLNMCSALAACRDKGMMYVDLKPENVFLSDDDRFCIGDIGFVSMASLQYISLPEKYLSIYTAPEVNDAYATISENTDVYAVGMMLYNIYNNGLPSTEALTPAEYADYEMWKIISKACHADPAQRYKDPNQLRCALLNYIDQFGVSDLQIVKIDAEEIKDDPCEQPLFLSEDENNAMLSALLNSIPDEQPPTDSIADETESVLSDEIESIETDEMLAQADDLINHQLPQPVVAPTVFEVAIPELPLLEDTEPTVEPEAVDINGATESLDTADMTESVEECDAVTSEENQESIAVEIESTQQSEQEILPDEENTDEIWDAPKKSNFKKLMIVLCSVCAVIALFIAGIFVYISHFFNQEIEGFSLTCTTDSVTVIIASDIKDDLLTVVCTNAHGTALRAPVVNGKAQIQGLKPNTTYRINIEISGNHKLIGKTSDIFTTASILNISDLNVVDGVWQGSVDLSFVATGSENNNWIIRYYTEGELEQTLEFSGSKASVTGLQSGKEYTFILEPAKDIPMTGTYRISYTVK